MKKLLCGLSALALSVGLAAGLSAPASAQNVGEVDNFEIDVRNNPMTIDIGSGFDAVAGAISINVERQVIDNQVNAQDAGGQDADLFQNSSYTATITLENDFDGQIININGLNTGINVGQQGAIAVAVENSNADLGEGTMALNVLGQDVENTVRDHDELIEESNGPHKQFIEFGSAFEHAPFANQVININGLNTGINAGQQGGIAVATSNDSSVVVAGQAELDDFRIEILSDGAINIENGFDAVLFGAFASNVMKQDVTNEIHPGENDAETDGHDVIDHSTYDSSMGFSDGAFDLQVINVNGANSGLNAAQQGAIALAVDQNGPSGAVSLNVLSQVVTNDLGSADEGIDELLDSSTYDSQISFGGSSFGGQVMNVNGFNTGINAAQQGAIAVAVNSSF